MAPDTRAPSREESFASLGSFKPITMSEFEIRRTNRLSSSAFPLTPSRVESMAMTYEPLPTSLSGWDTPRPTPDVSMCSFNVSELSESDYAVIMETERRESKVKQLTEQMEKQLSIKGPSPTEQGDDFRATVSAPVGARGKARMTTVTPPRPPVVPARDAKAGKQSESQPSPKPVAASTTPVVQQTLKVEQSTVTETAPVAQSATQTTPAPTPFVSRYPSIADLKESTATFLPSPIETVSNFQPAAQTPQVVLDPLPAPVQERPAVQTQTETEERAALPPHLQSPQPTFVQSHPTQSYATQPYHQLYTTPVGYYPPAHSYEPVHYHQLQQPQHVAHPPTGFVPTGYHEQPIYNGYTPVDRHQNTHTAPTHYVHGYNQPYPQTTYQNHPQTHQPYPQTHQAFPQAHQAYPAYPQYQQAPNARGNVVSVNVGNGQTVTIRSDRNVDLHVQTTRTTTVTRR